MGKHYVSNYDGNDKQKWVRIAIASKDKEAIKALLNSEEGRWFLARLMKDEGLMSTAFTGNSGTFYNEGRRSVAVDIYQKIKSLLGVEGIKLFHAAQEELIEFEEKALRQAEEKGADNG